MSTIDLVKRLRTMAKTGWNPIGDEAADEIERLRARVASLEESLHYANGTADLAMKHRDDAEKRVAELERALLLIEPSGDFSGWEDKHGRDIGNSINAALAKGSDL